MSANKSKHGPLGGIFSFAGAIIGALYANAIGGNLLAAAVFGVIGGYLGLIVEHIVFRLIIIALTIIAFIARQALFEAVRESFASIETPLTDIYAVAELSMHKYTIVLTLLV